jgi:hypothetical protein
LRPGSESEVAPPAFVVDIVISLFVFSNTFAIYQWLQRKQVGRWKIYLQGERSYITLSLVAKTALAWQAFSGAIIPAIASKPLTRWSLTPPTNQRQGAVVAYSPADSVKTPFTRRGISEYESLNSTGNAASGASCHANGRRNRRIAVTPTDVCAEFVAGQGPPWC